MPVVIDESRRFDLHAPVLVVGAGACGLVAALAARDAGAEVLVLERDAAPAGSTALSSMRFCPRIDRRPIRRKSLRPRRMLRIVWPRSFTAITGCGKLHADSIWNLRRQGIRSCVRPIAFGVRSDSA